MSDDQPASTQSANALRALPAFDLVGPNAEADIRRAVTRYGAEAVKAAVKSVTKAKPGRKRLPDFKELKPIIEEDARIWLDGGDPFEIRTNYRIAKDFAETKRGHSAISTFERIKKKLRKDRLLYTYFSAYEQSKDGYPFRLHILALRALSECDNKSWADIFSGSLEKALQVLEDYEAREAGPPPESMSFKEIEEAVAQGSRNALAMTIGPRGIFGAPKNALLTRTEPGLIEASIKSKKRD